MKRSFLFLLSLTLTACAPQQLAPQDELGTIVAQTLAVSPATSTPLAADPATATPEANRTYFTHTSSENVNLRTDPGLLFPVSRVMPQGRELQVLGLAPGGDWAYVFDNADGLNGWVDVTFVEDFPHDGLLVIDPQDVQEIKGNVTDANGNPVSGIVFSITQGTNRTETSTDETGVFHAYLPVTLAGRWTVAFNAIEATSNVMTPACLNDHVCGTTDPKSIELALPATEVLLFVWK
jgi:hypothetical protein